jgi:hypothetical protein
MVDKVKRIHTRPLLRSTISSVWTQGATLEYRIKKGKGKGTSFADLIFGRDLFVASCFDLVSITADGCPKSVSGSA